MKQATVDETGSGHLVGRTHAAAIALIEDDALARATSYNPVVTVDEQIAVALADVPGIVAAYVFGSTARGTATGESDVDVGVLFAGAVPATLNGRFALEGELERQLGRRVDLLPLNDAPVDVRIRVLRDGHLVVERDASARVRFEVRTRNESWDLEPILATYRAARSRS